MRVSGSRVLVVTAECDFPPRSGGALRAQRLLRSLADHAPVRVLAVQDTDGDALRMSTGVDAVVVHPRSVSATRARLRALLRRWPVPSARWWHPEVAAEVAEHVADGGIVVLDHVWLSMYAPRRGAVVLSTQNVDSELVASLPRAGARWRGWEQRWDVAMLKRMERRVAGRPDIRVVTVSAGDAEALGRPDALVIENGTDVPPSPPDRPAGGRLLYVGNMSYQPNRLAVRWWLDEVRPLLSTELPLLTVVGRGARLAFGDEAGLDVLDEVEDMAPVLAETRVVVVPLQHGGGTRLKVLEALAWRRPVVSTSKGAEGLGTQNGEHLVLADDPVLFAKEVGRLYGDDPATDSLIAQGATLASRYDWRILGERFAAGVVGMTHG